VKELRQITLEFVVPPTRPDFVSKPDQLLTQLLSYPGEGGLLAWLKHEGLANSVVAYTWERTESYGSLQMQVSLTPAGQEQHAQVLGLIFSYLDHLRRAPFPEAFHRERARIAALNETFRTAGKGRILRPSSRTRPFSILSTWRSGRPMPGASPTRRRTGACLAC
jgi:secreted Zn-dependent insulinase-like peptidase